MPDAPVTNDCLGACGACWTACLPTQMSPGIPTLLPQPQQPPPAPDLILTALPGIASGGRPWRPQPRALDALHQSNVPSLPPSCPLQFSPGIPELVAALRATAASEVTAPVKHWLPPTCPFSSSRPASPSWWRPSRPAASRCSWCRAASASSSTPSRRWVPRAQSRAVQGWWSSELCHGVMASSSSYSSLQGRVAS